MSDRSVGLHFFEQVIDELNRRLSGLEDGYLRLLEDNQRLSKEIVTLKQSMKVSDTSNLPSPISHEEPQTLQEGTNEPHKKVDFLGEKVINIISGKVQSVCSDYIKLRDNTGTKLIPSAPFKGSEGFDDLCRWHNYVTLTQYQNSPPTIEFNRYH